LSPRLSSGKQQNEKFGFHGVFLVGGIIFLDGGESALVPVFTGSGPLGGVLGVSMVFLGVSVFLGGAVAAGFVAAGAVEEAAPDFVGSLR